MVISDGVGDELFEFKQNDKSVPVFNHISTEMFHSNVQDPDI